MSAAPVDGEPIGIHDILTSRLWRGLANFLLYDFQTTMFQPVGGMGRIGEAFARQLPGVIRYGARVTDIGQDESGVRVHFEDFSAGGALQEARADWCVCTLPLSILSELPIDVSAPMKAAIDAVPYAAAVKVGLQFSRRFWEEDEHIFGGISYTDLPIRQISYPSGGLNAGGKGVLLGGYLFGGPNAYEFTAMSPAERIERAVEFGAQIHPQYRDRVRERRRRRMASGALHAGLRRRLVGRSAPRALRRPLPDRRTGSCWPASTPPSSPPGRRGRSSRRSTRSAACISAVIAP